MGIVLKQVGFVEVLCGHCCSDHCCSIDFIRLFNDSVLLAGQSHAGNYFGVLIA
jgi:hypothetical protein